MAQNGRDKKPPAIVRKTARGLYPVSAYDAEMLMMDALGTEYDLVKRTKRSNPQLRLYWSVLGRVVKATDKWATSEHLSKDIKDLLGYRQRVINELTGEVRDEVDSIALNAMSHDDFMVYFDKAMAVLADKLGYDPLAFMEDRV